MPTVGYGDRVPVTVTGRVVAVGLMLGGVALLGTVAALRRPARPGIGPGDDVRHPMTDPRLTTTHSRQAHPGGMAAHPTPRRAR